MRRRLFLQLGGAAFIVPNTPFPALKGGAAPVSKAALFGKQNYVWAQHMARVHGRLTSEMLDCIGLSKDQSVVLIERLSNDRLLVRPANSDTLSSSLPETSNGRLTAGIERAESVNEPHDQDVLEDNKPNLSSKASNPSTNTASDDDICDRNVELRPPSVDNPDSAAETPPEGSVEN